VCLVDTGYEFKVQPLELETVSEGGDKYPVARNGRHGDAAKVGALSTGAKAKPE